MSSSDEDDVEMQLLPKNNQDSSAENNHSPHREQPGLAATENKQDPLAGKTSTPVVAEERDPGRRLYEALWDEDRVKTDRERDAEFDAALVQLHEFGKGVLDEALTRRHGRYTCLQRAANDGLEREVGELLKVGANFGSASNSQDSGDQFSALYYACYYGYHLVLERLLKKVKETKREIELLETDDVDNTLLHQVTFRGPIRREASAGGLGSQKEVPPVNRVRCIELLFEYCDHKQKIDVNAQNIQGYTALHNAAKHEDQSMVVPLIKEGANIGIKDNNGTMPVEQIQPVVMEAALDVCVSGSKHPPGDDQFSITFQYDCLVPPGERDALSAVSEMAPLIFLNKSRWHRRLLLHPVLSSFITGKWLKMQRLYWLAVVLYAVFGAILTAYVYLKFHLIWSDSTDSDMSNSMDSATSNSTDSATPIFTDSNTSNSTGIPSSPRVSAVHLVVMEVALWVVLVLLLLRELLELVLSCRDYFSDRENILQVILITLLAMMLIGTGSELTRLNIAVWVIILAWLDFVLLLGRYPKLFKYIMMFKTVSENFIKFIFLFSSLIISFSIAFHLLFRTNEHFNTYWLALLKTFVMSTGEMEYNSLKLTHYCYFSRITFFGFLFLILLVLMNMLNALAVSDTKKIQDSAELYSLIARISLIKCLMVVVLGPESVGAGCPCSGKTQESSAENNHSPHREQPRLAATNQDPQNKQDQLAGKNNKLQSCHKDGRLTNVRDWLARRVLLFPKCANRSMTVWPKVESSRLFCFDSPVEDVEDVKKMLTRFCWRFRCHSFDVGKNVVKAAYKKHSSASTYSQRTRREGVLMDRMEAQERKLDDLIKMVEEVKRSMPG